VQGFLACTGAACHLSMEDGTGLCIWQGVAIESPKFHPVPPCPTLQCPAGGLPLKRPLAVSGVAHLQGKRLAAVFYPFGHPTPYSYGRWYRGSEAVLGEGLLFSRDDSTGAASFLRQQRFLCLPDLQINSCL
jgi:hypothetical protein